MKQLMRVLSLVLVWTMLLGSIVPSQATTHGMEGSGTQTDPYIIMNVKDLQAMDQDLSAHYVLGRDIDATETEHWNDGAGFSPIGLKSGGSFTGSFDGQGYSIKDLRINRPNGLYVGLFSTVKGLSDTKPSTISNVVLEQPEVTGSLFVGSVAGEVYGATLTNVKILQGSITGVPTGNFDAAYVGGLTSSL